MLTVVIRFIVSQLTLDVWIQITGNKIARQLQRSMCLNSDASVSTLMYSVYFLVRCIVPDPPV